MILTEACRCNRADFSIAPCPGGGYVLRPLGDHVDDLLSPLEELGIEWLASEWAFYCPAARLDSFRRWCFVNAIRVRRAA